MHAHGTKLSVPQLFWDALMRGLLKHASLHGHTQEEHWERGAMRARVEGLLDAADAAVTPESVRARTRMPEPYDMPPKESIAQVPGLQLVPAHILPYGDQSILHPAYLPCRPRCPSRRCCNFAYRAYSSPSPSSEIPFILLISLPLVLITLHFEGF